MDSQKFLLLFFLFLFSENLFAQNSTKFSVSSFTTYGKYSDDRDSKALGVYATMLNGVQSSYSLGVDVLLLSSKGKGGKFFTQEFIPMRGSWWLGGKWSVSAHTAFLNEESYKFKYVNAGQQYDTSYLASRFYFFGGGAMYHLARTQLLTLSATGSLHEKKIFSQSAHLKFTTEVMGGITGISSVDVSKTESTQWLYSGKVQFVYAYQPFLFNVKLMAGKRVFYFDESLLVLFNQREIQTLSLGGGISYYFSPSLSVSATYELEKFSQYRISYFAAGAKYLF